MILLVSLGMLCLGTLGRAATNRSAYIPYNLGGGYGMSVMALDTAHQQIFTAWQFLDRVDVLSTVDYHLIRSIPVPSPDTLDISPDSSTIAVGNSVATILFFSTTTYAKTGEYVLPGMGYGINSLVYTATGDLIVTASNGTTSAGITIYWNHITNSEQTTTQNGGYLSGALAQLSRSSDYIRIIIGSIDEGGVQIVDGTTGLPIYIYLASGMVSAVAVNKGGSRYAICASSDSGYTPSLIILDANFDVIYQRVIYVNNGTNVSDYACSGITFSADGNTLYGDTYSNNTLYTQAIDMNTFESTYVADYFTGLSPTPTTFTNWQAADTTGMVYGIGAGVSSDGPVWLAQDMTATAPPTAPLKPYQYPVQLIRVIDSIGSPQGGDSIDLLCTGLSNEPVSSIQVTIGGKPATVVANPLQTNYPPYQTITVTTPPGTPGVVDVTLQFQGTTSIASKAFQYAQSRTIYPFATSPTFLVYDAVRNLLYAAHGNQVEVIDAINQKVLTPLIPVSGKSTNSQFAGISLSPDSNRLWIADAGANLIHMINLANPGTGYDINPAQVIGSSIPIAPGRVFELSNGQLLGSNGTLFVINPSTMSGDWARDSSGIPVTGYAWNSTNAGENVLLTKVSDGVIGPDNASFGLWNVNNGISVPTDSRNSIPVSGWETAFISFEASANEDGIVIGSSLSVEGTIPIEQFADFSLNAIGTLYEETSDPITATGGTSFGEESSVLHPSGALFYQAGNHNSGIVDIADVQHMQSIGIIAFPEQFPYLDESLPNNIYYNHILTIDPTGQYLFSVTKSGITEMVLNTVPLSIGNVQPAFVPALANQTITIRGSGFQKGAEVSFGGVQVETTYVDVNTLTATPPALAAGWTDITVTLPSGATYTAPGLLHVIGQETAPVLTGFFPAAIIYGNLGTITVTLLGSGFDISDMVEVNGLPVPSAFIDSSHMQATINISLLNQAIAVEVVSPYAGASNTLSLPIVNPVPSIQSTYPVSLPAGGVDMGLIVLGSNFVPFSVVQFNGQNLSTQNDGGIPNVGETLWATVPANLIQNAGTATITVENPAPGGGLSNSLSINISTAQAQVNLPASIDFGEVPPNTTSTLYPFLTSVGSASYTVTSVTVTPGPFTAQALNCTGLLAGKACSLVVTFTPTSATPYTGNLTINDNTEGSPHTIPLTGTGIISTAPTVTLTSIDDVWPSTSVFVTGNAYSSGISSGISVGFPATAWMEYGTDPTLSTFTASSSWSTTIGGDQNLATPVTGVLPLSILQPATTYAMRLAVQTAGGTGRSAIHQFATYQNLTTPGFSVSGTPVTVAPGATSGNTSTITVTPGGGFTGSVILSTTCSGPNVAQFQDPPTFSFNSTSPVNITGTTAVTATLTVYTTAPSTATLSYPARPGTPWYVTGGAALACILLFGIPVRRRSWRTMLGMLALLVVLSGSVFACGGGSNAGGGGGGGNNNSGTTAGTYIITLTGTSGTTTATSIVILTVQ
jgi:hypothetical protein